jgi:hypothetical protein
MSRFQEITQDSDVVLRPWLQAFAWRTRTYSPDYILRQIKTAKDKDGIGYLFWNARNDYSKPFIALAEMRSSPHPSFAGEQAQTTHNDATRATAAAQRSNADVPRTGETSHPSTHSAVESEP